MRVVRLSLRHASKTKREGTRIWFGSGLANVFGRPWGRLELIVLRFGEMGGAQALTEHVPQGKEGVAIAAAEPTGQQ